MMSQPIATTPPRPDAVLPYADLPARWGVSLDKGPNSLRVTVPPVPSWRHLGVGFHAGILVLAAIIVAWCIAAVFGRRVPPSVFVPQILTYALPLAIVVAVATERLRRRIVVAISGATVSLGYLTPRGTGRWVSWPRAKVSEIKINAGNGKLLFRVQGADLVERYLGPNAELNHFVADTLAAALRDLPATAGQAAIDDAAAPPPNPGAGRALRRLMFACGVAMFAAGVVSLFFPFPAGVMGMYVLIGSCVPFGIVYGTQPKTFWV